MFSIQRNLSSDINISIGERKSLYNSQDMHFKFILARNLKKKLKVKLSRLKEILLY